MLSFWDTDLSPLSIIVSFPETKINLAFLKYFIEDLDCQITIWDSKEQNTIFYAANLGHTKFLEYLIGSIRAGSSLRRELNNPNLEKETVLHSAVKHN